MAAHGCLLTTAVLLAAAAALADARHHRNFCPVTVQRQVTCRVKNGTEEYDGTDYSKCYRTGNWNDCRHTVRRRRPKYVTSFKMVNRVQYRCWSGL
ncbi:EMILIN-3-like [Pollicipes pollicipes]|uniref:EMILIN-3-like n=1 Tax=Pollicipes pollicipes TaxID=41117 RepID=UPI0018852F73|nr:EMILIN-3-like [Pollicipes pollicipes]